MEQRSDFNDLFYMIPKSMFCKEVTMYDFLVIVFIQHFKSINDECIFTVSTLLRYYGLDEHHRKIKHVLSGIDRLNKVGIIEVKTDYASADKHSVIIAKLLNVTDGGSKQKNGFTVLYYRELLFIMHKSILTNNYNLLTVFMGVKRGMYTTNHAKNSFSSDKVSYRTVAMNVGVSNGFVIKECVDELSDIGVLSYEVVVDEENDKKFHHVYSVKTVKQLNKLHLPT